MSAGGGVPEKAETAASESNVQRYETVHEKIGLLVERMSECLRLVEEYTKRNKRPMFGVMKKRFPMCIEILRGKMTKQQRIRALDTTFIVLSEFDWQHWPETKLPEFEHIRNEMQNLTRIYYNMYTKANKEGLVTVNTVQGPLMKWHRQDTGDFAVAGEREWKTKCVICLERVRDVVLFPCTHFALCRPCSDELRRREDGTRTCPLCRGGIESIENVGQARLDGKTYIQSAEFPEREGYTRRLLNELEALGDSCDLLESK